MTLTGAKGPKALILGIVRRRFFQELKLLVVFRRRVAVVDGGGGGGGGIIHSLASDDISGNILQLDSGGVGGG